MILVGTCKEHFNDLCNCPCPCPHPRRHHPRRRVPGLRLDEAAETTSAGSCPLCRTRNLGAAVREMLPLECQNDAEAVRDFQAEWLREQDLITSDSVLDAVRLARGTITHVGGGATRAVLDALEREADAHSEGVPGHVVAKARLQFDELMRRNVQ